MIADRWFASANVSHSSRALEQPHTGRIVDWQIGYNGTLHYLLEDRWSLSLGFDGNERHDASGDRQLQRLQIGVSRWFTGILSAPGVILPLRRSGEVF